jgi:hypothetical protein
LPIINAHPFISYMPYAELLLSNEWQFYRSHILDRDKKTCQICHNQKLLKSCHRGNLTFHHEHISSYIYYHDNEINEQPIFIPKWEYAFNNNGIRFRKGRDASFLKNCHAFFETIDDKNYLVAAKKKNSFDEVIPSLSIFERPMSKKIEEAINLFLGYSKDQIIEYINNESFDDINWHLINGLHVHHLYYQKSKRPWEYPFNALITVCWKCHESIHSNKKIDYFDENFTKIGTLTPCYRCHGAGYFPEYLHVEEGICFRCKGARYEELRLSNPIEDNE